MTHVVLSISKDVSLSPVAYLIKKLLTISDFF